MSAGGNSAAGNQADSASTHVYGAVEPLYKPSTPDIALRISGYALQRGATPTNIHCKPKNRCIADMSMKVVMTFEIRDFKRLICKLQEAPGAPHASQIRRVPFAVFKLLDAVPDYAAWLPTCL